MNGLRYEKIRSEFAKVGPRTRRDADRSRPSGVLASGAKVIWAGTDKGVYRIGLPEFEVSRVGAAHLDQPVTALALRGDSLWIGGRRLAHLNVPTHEVQLFSSEEIGPHLEGKFWQRFLFDGPYVWVQGAYRLDTRNGSWSVLSDPENGQPRGLIGLVDGILWTYAPGRQRSQASRIAIGNAGPTPPPEIPVDSGLEQIDESTLALKPVQMLTSGAMFSGPVSYMGRFEGKPVFDGWFYDPAAGILRPVPNQGKVTTDAALPDQLGRSGCWQRPDDVTTCTSEFAISFLKLPSGTSVLAKRDGVAEYLWNREHYGSSYPRSRTSGVWFGNGAGPFRRSSMQDPDAPSASLFLDTLPSDFVHQAVAGPNGETWIAMDHGVVRTDSKLRIRNLFGKDNGLPTDRITSIAFLDGILYFASDSPDRGGLIAYDPKAAVFTLYTDRDGLPTRAVESLAVSVPGQLEIRTAIVQRPQASKDLRYPPVFFDPKRRLFSKAGEPALVDKNSSRFIQGEENGHGVMPWLGGPVLGEFSLQDRRILYGSRGVVITTGPASAREPGVFSVHESGSLLDEAAAGNVIVSRVSPEGVAPLLRDRNPFVRLKALNVIVQVQRGGQHWTDVLASTPEDTFLPVRRLAVRVLAHAAQPERKAFFERGLSDPDQEVRDACAYGLVMLGSPAPMEVYESILRRDRNNGWPVPDVYEALAKQPTPDVIALMLRHPLVADSFEPRRKLIQQIGSSLIRYPESIEVLLRVRNSSESFIDATAFAQAVLAAAGAAVADRLTEALHSNDHVTRSNAARALGLMGDRTAIPALLAALERERGQPRGSIVWALGRLHALEAVPGLANLYVMLTPPAEAPEKPSLTQVDAEIEREYEGFGSVAALKAAWDAEWQVRSWSPDSTDNTLMRREILAALAEIGPTSVREFYRSLARSRDPVGRREAAVRLFDGGSDNADDLRSLANDQDPETAIAAAVSLFLLGDPQGQAHLARRMEQCDSLYFLLNALRRITDAKRLAFLKPAAADCEQKGAVGGPLQDSIDRILERNRR